ncbi:DNA-3-methyladenine glycosylase I [Methylovorus menthalis]|uniref:DNA-3-methyladenine glycosylase I n=1 Tax=Methylovorus menthalis TaxID=1002227 RepID=UPI001E3C41CF|nr:DNA-3-methyladenine glycosylase I [Methylovorus menthalis]
MIEGDGQCWVANSPLSERISKELKKRLQVRGPTIVYAWMQAVGMVNDHALDCFCRRRTIPEIWVNARIHLY